MRFMRLMLFFDLPMESSEELRNYRAFRKIILKEGFIMEQKSVYSKLVLNDSAAKLQIKRLKSCCPEKGLVEILVVTERQYSKQIRLTGDKTLTAENDVERILIF